MPYLALMKEDAPQREHSMQELFNGLRYVIRYGIAWRAMPNDLPPWHAVHQQAHRWLAAGCFEALAQDLRAMLPSSGPSPGRHAAGVSSRTTSDTPKPSPACTSSPSQRSWPNRPQLLSEIHNSL